MTIVTQGAGADPVALAFLAKIADDCNKKINAEEDKAIKNKKKKRTCQKAGQDKHKCCDDAIKEHNKDPNATPKVEGEKCYDRPNLDSGGKAIPPVNTTPVNMDRGSVISGAIASCGTGATRQAISSAIGQALKGKIFPDAAILGPNGEKTFVDFKFACPESHRSKRKKARKNYRPPSQSKDQAAAHTALGQATGGGPTATITGFT
jgi:hypothetical protein